MASSFQYHNILCGLLLRFHSVFMCNKYQVLIPISSLIFILCAPNGSQQNLPICQNFKSLFIYKYTEIQSKFTSIIINPIFFYIRHLEFNWIFQMTFVSPLLVKWFQRYGSQKFGSYTVYSLLEQLDPLNCQKGNHCSSGHCHLQLHIN